MDRARTGKDRALGIHADDLHAGHFLFQLAPHTRDRAARTRGHHARVELGIRLLEDLFRRAVIVRGRVIRVGVLIKDVRVRQDLPQLLGHTDVAARRIPCGFGRRADDLRAQCLEHNLLLAAHLLGHRDDHAVAVHSSRHGQTDAGVAAGGLDQRVARLDAPTLLGLQQHALANAVLDGTAGREELALDEELAASLFANGAEAHHRGVTDGVEDGIVDVAHYGLSFGRRAHTAPRRGRCIVRSGRVRCKGRVGSSHPGRWLPRAASGSGGPANLRGRCACRCARRSATCATDRRWKPRRSRLA